VTVLEGRAAPDGDVVVVDDLGFHQATSVAELLADRGASVEVMTPGMVVGQDLGITLDMEGWLMRAHAKGIVQSTDLVVMGATAFDGGKDGDGVTLDLLHHPTGAQRSRSCDWVVVATHQQPVDELWRELLDDPALEVHRIGGRRCPQTGALGRHRGPSSGGGTVSEPRSEATVFGSDSPLAIVVARSGELPVGADEVVAEAGGRVLVVGEGARAAAELLTTARHAWTAETGRGLRPGDLARALAPSLYDVPLVILPASPDGRDLAPRLAAELDRPLLAAAHRIWMDAEAATPHVAAVLSRVEGRIDLPVTVKAAAVATLVPGVRGSVPTGASCSFAGAHTASHLSAADHIGRPGRGSSRGRGARGARARPRDDGPG